MEWRTTHRTSTVPYRTRSRRRSRREALAGLLMLGVPEPYISSPGTVELLPADDLC